MSISIHELLAVARESEGVKAVKGDDILCEKRFAPDTRYMVECKLCLNGMPVPLLRNCYSIFNGTKYR